ncbi:unnamed protein product [Schistocephalus solidus]|uniref:Dimerisation domain-containing protein n=1 Tax=Schistocephalus solidus TaxID=70667 RepID=A0A183SMI5_SCHSO|nr:unnamed protein product [Schistocephalus solidus]
MLGFLALVRRSQCSGFTGRTSWDRMPIGGGRSSSSRRRCRPGVCDRDGGGYCDRRRLGIGIEITSGGVIVASDAMEVGPGRMTEAFLDVAVGVAELLLHRIRKLYDAGVTLALRSDIVERLSCLPKGIKYLLMALRLLQRGSKFATINSAYAFPE